MSSCRFSELSEIEAFSDSLLGRTELCKVHQLAGAAAGLDYFLNNDTEDACLPLNATGNQTCSDSCQKDVRRWTRSSMHALNQMAEAHLEV